MSVVLLILFDAVAERLLVGVNELFQGVHVDLWFNGRQLKGDSDGSLKEIHRCREFEGFVKNNFLLDDIVVLGSLKWI